MRGSRLTGEPRFVNAVMTEPLRKTIPLEASFSTSIGVLAQLVLLLIMKFRSWFSFETI